MSWRHLADPDINILENSDWLKRSRVNHYHSARIVPCNVFYRFILNGGKFELITPRTPGLFPTFIDELTTLDEAKTRPILIPEWKFSETHVGVQFELTESVYEISIGLRFKGSRSVVFAVAF